MAGRAEPDSEGRVVDAPVHPPTSFRPEAIGRGRFSGGQVLDRLQNDLIVGRWVLRNGSSDLLGVGSGVPRVGVHTVIH